jgi:hypothetical protein
MIRIYIAFELPIALYSGCQLSANRTLHSMLNAFVN